MDIEFDGLVIKVKDTHIRELLGSTNHHPRWAIAYKYPAKQVTTLLTAVERQVGRTGILTPVAHVEPVQLSWVTISKVTLHNPDFIREKDIRLWDRVYIQRSWEVIPYIVCTIPELRDGTQIIIDQPHQCPVCYDPIHTDHAESWNTSYYCVNARCPATIKESIKHFVSRDMMDIQWIWDAIIDAMVDNLIIYHYADLYKLITDPVMRMITKNLPGMGDKKIDLIILWLQKSKTQQLSRIVYALGIPQVGEKTAQIISDHLKPHIDSFEWSQIELLQSIISWLSNREFLGSIHSIGPETTSSIIDRITNEHNRSLMIELTNYGVERNHRGEKITLESSKLQYIRFAITGSFELSREQIISILVKQGATYCPNITSNTNFLIVWTWPSSKLSKCIKLNDSWKQLIDIIQGRPEAKIKLWLDK